MRTTISKIKTFQLSDKTKKFLVDLISYLFILLFLYAAFNKILDFQKFTVQIAQSPILTDYAVPIAWSIPVIELTLSVCLVFKRSLLPALYASFGLMVMFTTYIIVILNFAKRIPCSCGGILDKMGWEAHLFFNIFFVLLGLTAIIIETQLNENQPES